MPVPLPQDSEPTILPFVRPAAAVTGEAGFVVPMRLGLLAGGGEFPIRFARAARNAGHYVYGLGVAGMASEELYDACNEFRFSALGRFVTTREFSDIGKFKTPSLRNVALTGPYMHDGSIPTLHGAIEWELYAHANKSRAFTEDEIADIEELLKSLTSWDMTSTAQMLNK